MNDKLICWETCFRQQVIQSFHLKYRAPAQILDLYYSIMCINARIGSQKYVSTHNLFIDSLISIICIYVFVRLEKHKNINVNIIKIRQLHGSFVIKVRLDWRA